MPQGWKTKAWFSLALIFLATYYLVPTFFSFSKIRDKLKEEQKPLPTYLKFFPDKEIRLGLDLQGGIYVEMEVELEDAIKNRSDLIASEIERLLASESFTPQAIERPAHSSKIVARLKNEADREVLIQWVRKQYANVLVEKSDEKADQLVIFDLSENFAEQTADLAVKQALETIRHRIDRYGVSEPTITRLGGHRIAVELPGMTDPERALNLIKKAGRLEFKLVDESLTDEAVKNLVAEGKQALALQEEFTAEGVSQINSHLQKKIPKDSEILFEIQYDPITKKIVGGVPFLVKRKADVTGEMLKNAQVNVQNNEPYVSLSLNALGAKLFGEVTKNNIGKRLAIVLDGNVSKAPVIQSHIPNGEAQITLGYGDYNLLLREAEDLTLVLREGALPARLKELTKTVIGPSLGKDSIDNGVRITTIAALMVVLFMILYYKLSGFLANLALMVNVWLILGSLAIFQATLTLPGIAGIVLTMGMAVDANVLTFERMREEVRAGRSARNALQAGYANAMSAIIDTNLTTLLAGIVLYQFGTGPVRGFAVTLMIGIATTVFTAIIVTRLFQDFVLFGLKRERLSL